MNPYDTCVANKKIDGKLCIILWNVDELNISHVDSKVFDSTISYLMRNLLFMHY